MAAVSDRSRILCRIRRFVHRVTSLTRGGGVPDFGTTIHGRISLEAYVNAL
jgi:hypothetical protein